MTKSNTYIIKTATKEGQMKIDEEIKKFKNVSENMV